ncbi:MAG: hypothetical protein JJE53_00155 [Candidatus Pacebacteria bacterium]|nr:hypothetical protein [Candidatus Paceibacterota bacterium]
MKKNVKSSNLSTRADDLFDNVENILDIQEDLESKKHSFDNKPSENIKDNRNIILKLRNDSYFLLY